MNQLLTSFCCWGLRCFRFAPSKRCKISAELQFDTSLTDLGLAISQHFSSKESIEIPQALWFFFLLRVQHPSWSFAQLKKNDKCQIFFLAFRPEVFREKEGKKGKEGLNVWKCDFFSKLFFEAVLFKSDYTEQSSMILSLLTSCWEIKTI